MNITLKRAYEATSATDGYRILVDRLWPRGVSKKDINIDEWCKDVAPSMELRKWFAHDPAKFAEFTKRYLTELKSSDAAQQLIKRAKAKDKHLTLVFAARDPNVNHVVVLKQYLESL